MQQGSQFSELKKKFFFVFCFVWKIMIPLDPVASVEKGRTLASLVAQSVKNLPEMQKTWVNPWVGRAPLEGNGDPFQYSCLENSMDRWTWQTAVHGVAKSQTGLSNWHFFVIPHLTFYISTGILPPLFPWGLLGTFPHPIRGEWADLVRTGVIEGTESPNSVAPSPFLLPGPQLSGQGDLEATPQ